MNSKMTLTEIPPPTGLPASGDGDEPERERLLATWRLYPDALVDLNSPELDDGEHDGAGLVRMTDTEGNDIAEFRFEDAAAADEAVDFALRRINPGTGLA
jgi:hypothetical protein